MGSQAQRWRSLFVSHEDLSQCVCAHVVGPSSCLSLLEVAVPFHIPVTHPCKDLPDLAPVSIDSMVKMNAIKEFGYQSAYIRAVYDFLHKARAGIEKYGPLLGDFYRERYPKLQPWIEYLILLNDLPKANASSRRNTYLRDEFSQAAVFLALSIIHPSKPTARHLKDMSHGEVMKTLRNTLEVEFQNLHHYSQPDLTSIGLIRHVLVQTGGPQNVPQLNLIRNDCREARIAAVFARLMGAPEYENVEVRVPIDLLMRQLSRTRLFDLVPVDLFLITALTHKLKLPLFLLLTSLPSEWKLGFTSQAWTSLQAFMNDTCSLGTFISQPSNAERIFSIWSYTVHDKAPSLSCRIQSDAEEIFTRASLSLERTQSATGQTALDLMTMVCISRLFPKGETGLTQRSPIVALDSLFSRGSRQHMAPTLDRLLASLHRVLVADDFSRRDLRVARFIEHIGPSKYVLGLTDSHADQYWACRIESNILHGEAFSRLCWHIGEFPVYLAPLQISQREVVMKVEREEGELLSASEEVDRSSDSGMDI